MRSSQISSQTHTTYPIKIVCVVDQYSESGTQRIQEIRSYAHNSNILYTTRLYDSRKYADDREVITHLPAFHVYIQNRYDRTFYTDTRPIEHIEESIETYKEKEEKKQRQKDYWRSFYYKWFASKWRLFIQRPSEKDISRRLHKLEANTFRISDWS